MKNKNFKVYFDCGSSKIRVGAFNKENPDNNFFKESEFFFDHSNIETEIQKIITSLENDTKEYLNDVNLMVDSSDILPINISLSKKFDGSKLKKEDIKFLVQDVKQQILRNYPDQNILHIIIKKYKIDNIDYNYLPKNINCNLISLDIIFLCIPKKTMEYFKKKFLNLDISVNQVFCSSYAKSINYKSSLPLIENISFIDIGFDKTFIISYFKNEIFFFDIIPIGGNHITKDLCKVLKLNFKEAENLKLFLNKDHFLFKKKIFTTELIQQIILARIEELLKLCTKSINLNNEILDNSKIILMGGGSKILNNKFLEQISSSYNIELLEDTLENICWSAFNLGAQLNKQEVVVIPKKKMKMGIFERFFHLFN